MLPAERRGRRTRVCLRVRACACVCRPVSVHVPCVSLGRGSRSELSSLILCSREERGPAQTPAAHAPGLRAPRPAPEGVPGREREERTLRALSVCLFSFSRTKRLCHPAAALAFGGLGTQPWAPAWGACGAAAASLPAGSVWGPRPRGGGLTGPRPRGLMTGEGLGPASPAVGCVAGEVTLWDSQPVAWGGLSLSPSLSFVPLRTESCRGPVRSS